jgi:predicted transcriptional regulator of viral defense system
VNKLVQQNQDDAGTVKVESKKLEETFPKITDDLFSYGVKIFTRSDIEQIFSENRESWGLNKKTSVKAFIELMNASGLKEAKFDFPSRKETRYILGKVSVFELAQSLKPNAYLTHRGAMSLHGLTDAPPDLIYLNQEQSKQHQRSHTLTQEGIDRAFKNKPRLSNEIAKYGSLKVCIVHGQKTGGLGVANIEGENGEQLRVTNIERTLIDITVRPVYAGGASAVLEAYRRAKGKVSITKLVKTLQKMDYVYPYHQAVGFYLDRAGVYKDADLQQLKEIPMEFDFYLENRMDEPAYSESWRLHFPKGL